MTEPTLLETLRHIRFLDGITPEQLHQIASVTRLEDYQRGALIFREGERLPHIFLVAEGSVALEICAPGQGCKRIQTIGPGELLGWSPLLGRGPMTATARALAPTRLAVLDATQVVALCQHDASFCFTFMWQMARALASRLDATRLQLLDVYRHELPSFAGIHEGAD
jgi:CRP-like cAMP-binding protein